MTNLKEQFYQTKNIEFLKKTLGRELWVQVSGSKDINGASAAFWAALMPVENIDEAYRDYSWNSYIGTQCPGFIEYGDKITYEANPLNFDSCLNIVQYREFYGIKPNYVEISEEFRLLNNLYHDINTNIFYEIEENGECTEVAKIINNDCAYIKLKSLMKFAAAKQMALLLFFDIRVKISGSLQKNGLKEFSTTVNEDGLFFGLWGGEQRLLETYSYSILMGKSEHYPCFELFYRNTGGFLFGKPCDTRLSVFLCMANVYRETSKLRRCFHTPASLYEHGFSI